MRNGSRGSCDRCYRFKRKCSFENDDERCGQCEQTKSTCTTLRARPRQGRRPRCKQLGLTGTVQVWEIGPFLNTSNGIVEEVDLSATSGQEPCHPSSGVELLKLSLERGLLTLSSYLIQLSDVQEIHDSSPYLVAKFYSKYHFFMLGPSFAPSFRRAVQQAYISSPALLEGVYMAIFTAIERPAQTLDLADEADFTQGAVSLQQLRTANIVGVTDAAAILVLGQTLAAFDLLTKCVNSLLILRYSLSSVRPWYQELSKHSPSEVFTISSIFWDTTWCLLRRERPIIKFCSPHRPIVDRLAGLCTTLLPILYDLSVAGHRLKHGRYSEYENGMMTIKRIGQRILSWTAKEPEDLTESFSKEEVLGMKTQAAMYKSAGLLLAHRLVNPIGMRDDVAKWHASNIMLEYLRYPELAGKNAQLQQGGFPILIAALELPDLPNEIWQSIPLLKAAPICLAKLKELVEYVWIERRQAYSGYLLDLVDQGPDFVVIT